MDKNKGLKILSRILQWNDDESRIEFEWLRLMAAVKYDDYRDFLPGMRFLENLAAWLQQFETVAERRTAYSLLRKRLIYVSPSEMQRLVELLYPCEIERRLVKIIAQRRNIPQYKVWVDPDAYKAFVELRRRTLILGLSDGARIDILRHSTVGILSNEQFAVQTQLDHNKWGSLLSDLREAQPGTDAKFEVAFLVDDFMGTGSSFLRFDDEKKKWTGKLCKFLKSLEDAKGHGVEVMADNWQLCVHHYVSTQTAFDKIPKDEVEARKSSKKEVVLGPDTCYSAGAKIDDQYRIGHNGTGADLVALTRKYYSTKIETKHTDVGGVKHIGLGYGGCALPLILHHNTPNNSAALLWAEAKAGPDKRTGIDQIEMRPLFRRRQRHSDS